MPFITSDCVKGIYFLSINSWGICISKELTRWSRVAKTCIWGPVFPFHTSNTLPFYLHLYYIAIFGLLYIIWIAFAFWLSSAIIRCRIWLSSGLSSIFNVTAKKPPIYFRMPIDERQNFNLSFLSHMLTDILHHVLGLRERWPIEAIFIHIVAFRLPEHKKIEAGVDHQVPQAYPTIQYDHE